MYTRIISVELSNSSNLAGIYPYELSYTAH